MTACFYVPPLPKYVLQSYAETSKTAFTVRKTEPADDRYGYVTGCHIDISVDLTDEAAPQYIQMVRDNYNLNALTATTSYFNPTPAFNECEIALNRHKKEVYISIRYPQADVAAVQRSMTENMEYDWYDAKNGKMGYSYGIFKIELLFDGRDGNIYVTQTTNEMSSQLSAYSEPEISLAKLGFGFDDTGTCGVYEQHEPYYVNVAIHRPEWGEFAEDWNIEYLDTAVNGYVLRVTYHAAEDKYHITADKDNAGAAFDYLPATKQYTGEYPDMDTVKRMFNDAFGTQNDDFYDKPIAHFEQLVHDRFGIKVTELYALPIK